MARGFLAVLLAIVLGTMFYLLRKKLSTARTELIAERQRVTELESKLAHSTTPRFEPPSVDKSELMRLRAEVTALRAELAEAKKAASKFAAQKNEISPTEKSGTEPLLAGDRLFKSRTNSVMTPHDEHVRHELNRKEAELKIWWTAFLAYAEANGGDLPNDFTEAANYLPTGFQSTIDLGNFQKRSDSALRGDTSVPRSNLKNIENPKRTTILNERTPLVLSDGVVCNMYLFADGSVELFQ